MSNILVIGKLPPPVGGATTFVLRQIDYMKNNGHIVTLFPLMRRSDVKVVIKILFHRYDMYQLNSISLIALLFFMLTNNLKKVEVVDHNHSRHFSSRFSTKLKLWLLSKVKNVCLVNKQLAANYPSFFCNFSILNPFLPPTESEYLNAVDNVPSKVSDFIKKRKKIIVSSAWRYVEENGVELYGLNIAIKSFMSIERRINNVGLVICIGDPEYNFDKVKKLKLLAADSDSIVFWEGCSASWILFNNNAIYLRPTSTDGNSLSIHEALYFKAKVLASDVVDRPSGCLTYQYDNDDDLKNKLLTILE